tara:strand:- start:1428 stop:1571 length:144 start_codon:yes stop_codon:yes gene_type:complete
MTTKTTNTTVTKSENYYVAMRCHRTAAFERKVQKQKRKSRPSFVAKV